MYIVVQGDTTESKVDWQSVSGQVQGHLQPRQTVSLLKTSSFQADILQQNDPSVALKRHRGSGETTPQVVVVSKGDKSVSVMGSSLLTKSILKPYRGEPEKKIIKTGPKKPKPKEEDLKQKIRALRYVCPNQSIGGLRGRVVKASRFETTHPSPLGFESYER